MAERVLIPSSIQAYADATAITAPEVAALITEITTYGITQPGIEVYYRLLKALAP